MTRITLRYPPTALMMDERDGMRVFVPKSWSERPHAG
jgi:hypothetical protein